MRTMSLFLITFILIILSIIKDISLVYPLSCGLIILGIDSVLRGYRVNDVFGMLLKGVKKSMILYKIFALIGMIISVWMASGTVAGLMYYGFKLISPSMFIVISFLLTSAVSMLLGTSFGTVSTIGVALIAVGRGFGVNLPLLSGAIISGAYLGDRSSPMSSSAVLTSAVTDSNLYDNLKKMMITLAPAFLISLILYYITGNINKTDSYNLSKVLEIQRSINRNFTVSPLVLIPPVLIMLLSLFKIDIKKNMLSGIIAGGIIALAMQHVTILQLLKYAAVGYNVNFDDSFISSIIRGGGITSMVKAAVIIALSSALNGILEGTKMLDNILEHMTNKINNKKQLIIKTAVISLITGMYGCSQTLSIIMTSHIVKPVFDKFKLPRSLMARTIADTCVVISPLIPWNIAGLVPAVNMGVRVIDFIPYSFLCLTLPLMTIIFACFNKNDHNDIGFSD